MSTNPFDMDELLGAYALDAVSDEERRAVEDYLLANPRALAEVQQHREVATMLAWSGMDAPAGLWDRIAASLDGSETGPESELGRVLSMSGPRRRKRWARTVGSWAVATAAAATIAVVAVRVASDDTGTTQSADSVAAILKNPNSVQAQLTSSSNADLRVRAVIDPQGHGVLVASSLPKLDPSHTYQLWGQLAGTSNLISLGILGDTAGDEQFTVEGKLALLAITDEMHGGVVSSTNPPIVAGSPA